MAAGSSRGGSSARYALLGGGEGPRRGGGGGLGDMGSTGWAQVDSDEEAGETRGMSVPQLKQQQYSLIEGYSICSELLVFKFNCVS
jgi:hypothetical protein